LTVTGEINRDHSIVPGKLIGLILPVGTVTTPAMDKDQRLVAGTPNVVVDHDAVIGKHAVDNRCC
jgi:hypothetical protein